MAVLQHRQHAARTLRKEQNAANAVNGVHSLFFSVIRIDVMLMSEFLSGQNRALGHNSVRTPKLWCGSKTPGLVVMAGLNLSNWSYSSWNLLHFTWQRFSMNVNGLGAVAKAKVQLSQRPHSFQCCRSCNFLNLLHWLHWMLGWLHILHKICYISSVNSFWWISAVQGQQLKQRATIAPSMNAMLHLQSFQRWFNPFKAHFKASDVINY